MDPLQVREAVNCLAFLRHLVKTQECSGASVRKKSREGIGDVREDSADHSLPAVVMCMTL